ncbi:PEP/pyruvate-binding domain-containing protein [Nocardioides sambongensis]|uniref:PEP/pyruvate-binding domain-containing protein n=1 Tax=Nocardioides sambongensis TaxID=2589074 RepID=UPI0011295829|nr:PEP/pyruvate-binding domain-containing protein [Nocardioides sambongensis]
MTAERTAARSNESAGAVALDLEEIEDASVGGKAFGLARLVAMGLPVPPAFVIRDAGVGDYPADLDDRHRALGAHAVAVRSSAQGEDGAEASFAGQYETVLNVSGADELRRAIDLCVASASTERARSYQVDVLGAAGARMNVVVQRMVDALAAGVVFTADPVSARRDLLVIDAVAGLGEALVSGEATPDSYSVGLDGVVVRRDLVGDAAVLSDTQIAQIAEQARRAAAHEGHPLDLEWAIDRSGALYWLQARPITTLPADLNEFDSVLPGRDDVLTISNVSEMMPGAVCPLTMSFTGWGIDYGLQHMQVSVGARQEIDPVWQVTASAYGHLFLNLTGNLTMAAGTLGSDADQTAQTICGRVVPELEDPTPMPFPRRLFNTGKLLRYCFKAPSVVEGFDKEVASFVLQPGPDAATTWRDLAGKLTFFDRSMAVHIQSSALSGFYSAIVENMVSGSANASTVAEQAEAVRLLAGASGVESAVMLEELDELINLVAAHPDAHAAFVGRTPEQALGWLRTEESLAAGLDQFLHRHGHRGYRELCVRDPSWGDDPTPLVQSMQAAVHARLLTGGRRDIRTEVVDTASLSRGLRWVLPKAHNAIRRREHTKSLLVDVAHRFQIAFRHLGEQLASEGILPDADLVYFFTVGELRACKGQPAPAAVEQALARRIALEYQQRLEFPEISVGLPQPLEPQVLEVADGVLHGRPASRGVVEGVVRVAHTLTEAAELAPGEILVTPITDIGWTPYFSLIGGLVTDLGSSVSHGAVIAREYGLPCVVNARQATVFLKTGDRVRLDGDSGSVTLLNAAVDA